MAAPHDAVALEDDGGSRDDALVATCKEPADVVKPSHPTTALPPTTTWVMSLAEQQKMR